MSRGGRRTSTSLLADPSKIQRKIERLNNSTKKERDIIDELLLGKMPVHFGGMSDPFASAEIIIRSLQILATLHEIDYPVVISTKNTDILSINTTL
jgi:DNA repair photolyase